MGDHGNVVCSTLPVPRVHCALWDRRLLVKEAHVRLPCNAGGFAHPFILGPMPLHCTK